MNSNDNQTNTDSFYHSLFELHPDPVFFLDNIGVINKVNSVFSTKLGYDNNEVIYKSLESLLPNEDRGVYTDTFKKVLTGSTKRFHTKLTGKQGEILYIRLTLLPARKQGRIIGAFALAQEFVKEKDRYNEYLAYHDSLTGLPNRRFFEERLKVEINTSKRQNYRSAVLYLDLDRFKYMNDTLGHHLGDLVLKQIARQLKKCLKEDFFIARMGGDEFALLFSNFQGEKELADVSSRIIHALEKPLNVDEYELCIPTNIGVSILPEVGGSVDSILKYAAFALYKAKATGKNTYHIYKPSADKQIYKRIELENDLRNAIVTNQLELYYQPKVCSDKNQIVGAEALIRWKHPKWGIIPPNEFIPIAEETGMISEIERWVVYTACKQTKMWQRRNLSSIPISVNLTAHRFLEKDFVQTVIRILESTQLAPQFLEIEITESSLLVNDSTVLAILDDLRRIGIGISLDDFGTGYSSLSYLKRFKGKFDTLKLDRSFIIDLSFGDTAEDNYITKTIINLAQYLKMDVIAEGVETYEQLQILSNFKCNMIQGYLFSKPVPADDFAELLSLNQLEIKEDYDGEKDYSILQNHRVVQIDYPILAQLTFGNSGTENIPPEEVLIDQITVVGLRFISKTNLDSKKGEVLIFKTVILEEEIQWCGEILWTREVQPGIYQYGIEFKNEKMKES
ncbi:EAL domain-containing protein [Oceanobacillus halophilus]|nr:EAL domain-containing protein [Oceanobacillus halophilus]